MQKEFVCNFDSLVGKFSLLQRQLLLPKVTKIMNLKGLRISEYALSEEYIQASTTLFDFHQKALGTAVSNLPTIYHSHYKN